MIWNIEQCVCVCVERWLDPESHMVTHNLSSMEHEKYIYCDSSVCFTWGLTECVCCATASVTSVTWLCVTLLSDQTRPPDQQHTHTIKVISSKL